MKARIWDTEALGAVSPASLSAYARDVGWAKTESYGDHSDVYAAEDLPEIVLPRTQQLGDYTNVVSQLLEIFARAADVDELSLYRDLVTADRDVIRVRVAGEDDGAVALIDGVNLISGTRDMLLAAACSLWNPQPLYRAGANKEANDYLRQVRLGQTEQGSFTVTLLTPVIPPPMQQPLDPEWNIEHDPVERRITKQLAGALEATREATEKTIGGDADAFTPAVSHGISANLCEALVELIEPFPALDVSLSWARTRPRKRPRNVIRFDNDDVAILSEAARTFRNREPRPDERLFGFVHILKRDQSDSDGTITLRANIDGRLQSVTAVLNQNDYRLAINAHEDRAGVMAEGDLERVGQRWSLLNPRILSITPDREPAER
jgi:hypothetical protein